MPVVDPVLDRPVQPRHRFGKLALVKDLDDIGMLTHLDLVPDQAGRHRVDAAAEADRAPATHDGLERGVVRDARRWQRSKMLALERKLALGMAVDAALDDFTDE